MKRVLFGVVCAWVVGVRWAGAYQEIPIAVVAGSDQERPTVSQRWIAWEDDRAIAIVNGVRAEDRVTGTEFWVNPLPQRDYHSEPHLFGDTIVWQSNPSAKGVLFYDDLSNRQVRRVYDQPVSQYSSDIDGDLVVWHESAGNAALEGDIFGTYLGSGMKFPISTSGRAGLDGPVTDGQFVIWREWVGPTQTSLFMKDLVSGVSSLLAATGGDFQVDEGVAVYATVDGIAVRNLMTGVSSVIPTVTPFSLTIDGDLVVWSSRPAGEPDYDLFGKRLSGGTPFVISDAPGDQLWGEVHGNFVVWQDQRSGDYDIYAAFVPEPGSFAMAGVGGAWLLMRRKRLQIAN